MPSLFKTLIFALLVTVMFSVVASVARADMLPDGTPEEQYNYAIALTIEDGAEEAFKEFIVANPLHPNHRCSILAWQNSVYGRKFC